MKCFQSQSWMQDPGSWGIEHLMERQVPVLPKTGNLHWQIWILPTLPRVGIQPCKASIQSLSSPRLGVEGGGGGRRCPRCPASEGLRGKGNPSAVAPLGCGSREENPSPKGTSVADTNTKGIWTPTVAVMMAVLTIIFILAEDRHTLLWMWNIHRELVI